MAYSCWCFVGSQAMSIATTNLFNVLINLLMSSSNQSFPGLLNPILLSRTFILVYFPVLLSAINFPAADDNILTYLNDDGLSVEPIFYAPIIPMILINGSKGIGTGFSTDIMSYDPLQIISYLKSKLNSEVYNLDFIPYYEGFQGTIEKISDSKFLIKGKYEKVGADKIRVTELPVGYWTENFKEHLEGLIEPGVDKEGKKITPIIKDYEYMVQIFDG